MCTCIRILWRGAEEMTLEGKLYSLTHICIFLSRVEYAQEAEQTVRTVNTHTSVTK